LNEAKKMCGTTCSSLQSSNTLNYRRMITHRASESVYCTIRLIVVNEHVYSSEGRRDRQAGRQTMTTESKWFESFTMSKGQARLIRISKLCRSLIFTCFLLHCLCVCSVCH